MSRNIITTNNSLLALFVMSLCLALANADVGCIVDVMTKLIPCEGFLISGDASPTDACCSEAQSLDQQFAASDQPDRQAICTCIKAIIQHLPINLGKAAMLPALCKLSITMPIDPKVDCFKIGRTSGLPSKD